MTKMAIKICGLSDRAGVDAALAAGATHVGLVFFPKSPRNVSVEQAAALAAHVAGRAKVVGLFVNPAGDFLTHACNVVALDVIQLHGTESNKQAEQIRSRHGLETWKAIGIRESLNQANIYARAVDRVLYDAKPPEDHDLRGGTGLRIDWSLLAGRRHPLPWILAGGLDATNVAEAIRITGADFVDVSSGVESGRGIKDAAKIAQFCRAARES
ncbi:phosphoribosylanthranilate isomerase [Novosphingobium sp. FSY-8]|uniref:N-(5'-phosphoribosyl)anthranilate isomerase n=1 Tax=Novosphingobium ovatum TaxID=1908523 RepID=A0ABW9XBI5_9SPHN|nr:phosphoribosylanthranilate isomerase [Novosphingobium ovatum]NBC35891.1 phosphoribosylanthranilate isomerase [Novosphingobium ovatum]